MRREKLSLLQQTGQPTLIIVGNILDIKSIFVNVDNLMYKQGSALEAIDLVFKLCVILNLKYPVASLATFLFIQNYFYEIQFQDLLNFKTMKRNKKYSCITELVNLLK